MHNLLLARLNVFLFPDARISRALMYPTITHLPAGISARRPEISLRASAQRDVESAIILTL